MDSDQKTSSFLYKEISHTVEQRSNNLIGLPPDCSQPQRTSQVADFVAKLSEKQHTEEEIIAEFKRDFPLGIRKHRIRPHKNVRKKAKHTGVECPNRGKRRMTAVEKRKNNLVRINKKNKTFEMFVPIHKMWREYAAQALRIEQFSSQQTLNRQAIETMQNLLKKLEYFGSIIKVTKSRCSEYIGLEGIVIQETKNTFSIITVNDCVKVIPKLHTELSLVVGKFGFSILGNHLLQRPVDRAKHTLKKHCLWL